MAKLREVSDNYILPPDACPTFGAMYEELQRMEADLHQHIHLENNILFPRTIELEGRLGKNGQVGTVTECHLPLYAPCMTEQCPADPVV